MIADLNDEYAMAFYKAGGSDSVPYFVTMETDGDVFLIKFLGSHVYDSENGQPLSRLTIYDLDWLKGEIVDRARLFKAAFAFL